MLSTPEPFYDDDVENPFENKESDEIEQPNDISSLEDNNREVDFENNSNDKLSDIQEKMQQKLLNLSTNLLNNLRNPVDFIKEISKKSPEKESLQAAIAERDAALAVARGTKNLITTLENSIKEFDSIQQEINDINKQKENLKITKKAEFKDEFDEVLDSVNDNFLKKAFSEIYNNQNLDPTQILKRAKEFVNTSVDNEDINENSDDVNKAINILEEMNISYEESQAALEEEAFKLFKEKSNIIPSRLESVQYEIDQLVELENKQHREASRLSIAVNELIQKIEETVNTTSQLNSNYGQENPSKLKSIDDQENQSISKPKESTTNSKRNFLSGITNFFKRKK